MFRILTRQIVALLIAGALASFAVAPAHAGTLNLTGVSCTSLVVSGSGSNWTVACTSVTCQLGASNYNPAPNSSITLTPLCDSGATNYTFATTTGGCTTPAANGTVSESAARNCTYQVTGNNAGNTLQGQATTAVSWSTGTPAAPTGCTESAPQTSFPAAGGTINLGASCQTPASGIVWSWTRNGVQGWSAAQNPSEALPANGGSSAVTYIYQATACNGPSVGGGANCAVITPQISASVAGSGGGSIACSGFSNTVVLDIDWNNPQQVQTGNIGPAAAVVVRFTTGPNNPAYVNVTGAEVASTAANRIATLSSSACDFSIPPPLGYAAATYGSSVYLKFSVGPLGNYYPALTANTTYYVNVKTADTNCQICSMYFNLNR